MADEKKGADEQKKLGELVEKVNKELQIELKGKPYVIVIASCYEIGHTEDRSELGPLWGWGSNVLVGSKDGPSVAKFLGDQLKDVVNDPQSGINKAYKIKQ